MVIDTYNLHLTSCIFFFILTLYYLYITLYYSPTLYTFSYYTILTPLYHLIISPHTILYPFISPYTYYSITFIIYAYNKHLHHVCSPISSSQIHTQYLYYPILVFSYFLNTLIHTDITVLYTLTNIYLFLFTSSYILISLKDIQTFSYIILSYFSLLLLSFSYSHVMFSPLCGIIYNRSK